MTSYPVGCVVAFHISDTLQTAIITEADASHANVITISNELLRLPFSRFCLISATPWTEQDPDAAALQDFVHQTEERIASLSPDSPLLTAVSETDPLPFSSIAAMVAPQDSVLRFALYFFIRRNPEIFVWKKDTIRRRTMSEIIEFRDARRQREERELFLSKIQPCLQAVFLRNEPPVLAPEIRDRLVLELRELLLGKDLPDLQRALGQYSRSESLNGKIRQLRLELGDIDVKTDPALSESGLPIGFPVALRALTSRPEFEPFSCDNIFSIDELEGLDFDDALSHRSMERGHRFGIHIAAVASVISHDADLFHEAQNRVSSMYLACQTDPLFPEALSHDTLSLIAGQDRPVISLFVETDQDYRITGHGFSLNTIRLSSNFSYRDVDAKLSEYPFKEILAFCTALSRERQQQGVSKQEKDFHYYLRLKDDQLSMRKLNLNSPARLMVEEMMVLFNRLFAETALKEHVPLIFRNITRNEPDLRSEGNSPSQAYLSTIPDYHPGIGSSAYVHASSPIRRFTDLVNQYQLIARLKGQEPPFSKADLTDLIPHIEETIRLQREVQQKSERYWFLTFLQRDYLDYPLPAEVIKTNKHGLVVEILPWQKRILVKGAGYAHSGKQIQLVLHSIDPAKGLAIGDQIC